MREDPSRSDSREVIMARTRSSEKYCRNETVLAAFLTNTKAAQIAKAAGISRTTVYWLWKDSDFQSALDDRRREIQRGVVGQLTSNLSRNVATLQAIADDAEVSPQIRINAIQVLLRQHDTWTERLDILGELAELRQAVDTFVG